MNLTLPGRLHLIVRWRYIYATLWFRGRRYHRCTMPLQIAGCGIHERDTL